MHNNSGRIKLKFPCISGFMSDLPKNKSQGGEMITCSNHTRQPAKSAWITARLLIKLSTNLTIILQPKLIFRVTYTAKENRQSQEWIWTVPRLNHSATAWPNAGIYHLEQKRNDQTLRILSVGGCLAAFLLVDGTFSPLEWPRCHPNQARTCSAEKQERRPPVNLPRSPV